jgi:ATP-dependent Clp protease ATP-binding subunit ClpA
LLLARCSDEVHLALAAARQEARLQGCEQVGTEHLLLGVLHADAVNSMRELIAVTISLSAVRRRLDRPSDLYHPLRLESLAFSPQATLVLNLADEEARRRGRTVTSGADLLLALLGCEQGWATQALRDIGVDLDSLTSMAALMAARQVDGSSTAHT